MEGTEKRLDKRGRLPLSGQAFFASFPSFFNRAEHDLFSEWLRNRSRTWNLLPFFLPSAFLFLSFDGYSSPFLTNNVLIKVCERPLTCAIGFCKQTNADGIAAHGEINRGIGSGISQWRNFTGKMEDFLVGSVPAYRLTNATCWRENKSPG